MWFLPAVAGLAASYLGGKLGGGYKENPYMKELWQKLMGEYGQGTPDWMRQEYERSAGQAGAQVRNWGASNLPAGVASGNILGAEMQARAKAMEGLPGEAGRYRQNLLQMLMGTAGQLQPGKTAGQTGMENLFGTGGDLSRIWFMKELGLFK